MANASINAQVYSPLKILKKSSGTFARNWSTPPASLKTNGIMMKTAAVRITNCNISVTITAHKPPTAVYAIIQIPSTNVVGISGKSSEQLTNLDTEYKTEPLIKSDTNIKM